MGESYSRTLVVTAAAMLLIPKPAGVLANNRYVSAVFGMRCVTQSLQAWSDTRLSSRPNSFLSGVFSLQHSGS